MIGSIGSAWIALSILVACGSRADEEIEKRQAALQQVADKAEQARKLAVDQPRPEDAWERYRAAHVGAVTTNAVQTGKKLWPLLAADAQRLVETAGSQTIAAAGNTAIKIDPTELRYKVLGETAAVRAATMERATVVAIDLRPPRIEGGVTIASARLEARDKATTLVFELTRTGDGPWLIAASPTLLATDADVFKTPAGRESSVGAATVEALAAAWKQVNVSGTGWDAYNLMSPAMRKQILTLVARVGGSGAEDAARIFEKTLTDRRTRGVSVTKVAVSDATAERATVEVTYSSGKPDRLTAVKVDGAWWIEMPL